MAISNEIMITSVPSSGTNNQIYNGERRKANNAESEEYRVINAHSNHVPPVATNSNQFQPSINPRAVATPFPP